MKRKWVTMMLALALALVTATALWAQGRHGRQGFGPGMGQGPGFGPFGGHMILKLQERLNLTPEQSQQVRAILQKQHESVKTERAGVGGHEALAGLIFSDNPNQAEIQQRAQQMQQHHAQMLNRMVQTGLEINQVLTPEQRAELQKVMAEGRERRTQMREHMQHRFQLRQQQK